MLQRLCDTDPVVKATLTPHVDNARREAQRVIASRRAAAYKQVQDEAKLQGYRDWIAHYLPDNPVPPIP